MVTKKRIELTIYATTAVGVWIRGEGEGGEEAGFGRVDGGAGFFVGSEFVDQGEDGGDVWGEG